MLYFIIIMSFSIKDINNGFYAQDFYTIKCGNNYQKLYLL